MDVSDRAILFCDTEGGSHRQRCEPRFFFSFRQYAATVIFSLFLLEEYFQILYQK